MTPMSILTISLQLDSHNFNNLCLPIITSKKLLPSYCTTGANCTTYLLTDDTQYETIAKDDDTVELRKFVGFQKKNTTTVAPSYVTVRNSSQYCFNALTYNCPELVQNFKVLMKQTKKKQRKHILMLTYTFIKKIKHRGKETERPTNVKLTFLHCLEQCLMKKKKKQ